MCIRDSPHIKPGDLLLYYRLPQRYTAGETVVFEKDGTRYTGRVAARGGDTVEVTDTALLLINGSVVAEPDIYEPVSYTHLDVYKRQPQRPRCCCGR